MAINQSIKARLSDSNLYHRPALRSSQEDEDKELGRKCIAAVVGAMERSGCTVEAMSGAMCAYDEAGAGELVMGDFRSAMQQCGVGGELSKGVVEGIGRRWVGRKGVDYQTLLEDVGNVVAQREKAKRRRDVLKSMEEEKGVVGIMRDWEEEAENKIVGGQFDIFVPTKKETKPYITTRGKVASGKFGKDRTRKEAWRGNRGYAPSKITTTKERIIPKYLRNVESKIKNEIKDRRVRGAKLTAAKLELAKEVVAERRLKRYEEEGRIGLGGMGGGMGKPALAQEIASMYGSVVDDVVVQGSVGKEYWDEPDSEEEAEVDVGEGDVIVKQKGAVIGSGWVGEFDMGQLSKAKVKDKDVMAGRDEEIIAAKEGEGGETK